MHSARPWLADRPRKERAMAEPYPGEPFLAYLRDAYDVLYEEGTRALRS
jgi:hypothetical protein